MKKKYPPETLRAALAVRVQDDDAGRDVRTIRDYFLRLVEQLWMEGEGFSGKRPFGNSGWECVVLDALSDNNFPNDDAFVRAMIRSMRED